MLPLTTARPAPLCERTFGDNFLEFKVKHFKNVAIYNHRFLSMHFCWITHLMTLLNAYVL